MKASARLGAGTGYEVAGGEQTAEHEKHSKLAAG